MITKYIISFTKIRNLGYLLLRIYVIYYLKKLKKNYANIVGFLFLFGFIKSRIHTHTVMVMEESDYSSDTAGKRNQITIAVKDAPPPSILDGNFRLFLRCRFDDYLIYVH